MNREEKSELLSELNELFSNSEVVVVSHYKGLTVQEVSELRNKIREAGAGFRVTKNRITRLALKGTKFEGLADLFTGPTAIAFANDPISACKVCVNFAKDNEKLIVVGGAMSTGRSFAGSRCSAGSSGKGIQREGSRLILFCRLGMPVRCFEKRRK